MNASGMENEQTGKVFRKEFLGIALPVTLQCLLQSSFSLIDQLMTGQLGEKSIAAIGLAGNYAFLFSVLLSAIAGAAGIMIAQYAGRKNSRDTSCIFYVSLLISLAAASLFLLAGVTRTSALMALYTKDMEVQKIAASYLKIVSWTFLPSAVSMILAVLMRCMDASSAPMAASFANAGVNTFLNYVLIFGHFGLPALGVRGAAIASVAGAAAGCALTLILFGRAYRQRGWSMPFSIRLSKAGMKQFAVVLIPVMICEFLWSLGQNVYSGIYAHISTAAIAAMTLTNPVQSLFIGALSGTAQAAGIITGKRLGAGKYEEAYGRSKDMLRYGLAGALTLSLLLILLGRWYVLLFAVDDAVRGQAYLALVVFAVFAPVKVSNMILGGGILRSGGKTAYVMVIDLIGTWVCGIPAGYLVAFIWNKPVIWVYFALSLEECVRLIISLIIFKRKNWMGTVDKVSG